MGGPPSQPGVGGSPLAPRARISHKHLTPVAIAPCHLAVLRASRNQHRPATITRHLISRMRTLPGLHRYIMEIVMRLPALAAAAMLAFAVPPAVAEAEKSKPAEPLELVQPDSTEACLQTLQAVIDRAEEADMLDDQADEAEAELERMDGHCHEKRFAEALTSAKAVLVLVAANK